MGKRKTRDILLEVTFPKIGEVYPCFDDGKITISRLFFVKITKILKYKECDGPIKGLVRHSQIHHPWLFNYTANPYVIEAISGETEDKDPSYFLWSYKGFWFGIGDWFGCGELDLSGKLLDQVRNSRWSISREEVENIIKEGRNVFK